MELRQGIEGVLVGDARTHRAGRRFEARRASPRRRLIGDLLLETGAVSPEALEAALARQKRYGARLGDILTSSGVAGFSDVARAAAHQQGIPYLGVDPPVGAAAAERVGGFEFCLRRGVLPLADRDGRLLVASSSVEAAHEVSRRCADARLAMMEPRALRSALVSTLGDRIARRASTRRRQALSYRLGPAPWQRAALYVLAGFAAALVAFRPDLAVAAFFAAAFVIILLNAALWTAAPVASLFAPRVPETRRPARPPKVSLLIPLYREPETAPLLIRSLRALDYPPERLEVLILLESDDDETRAAILAENPPPHFDILVCPDGAPRTKPRALNFAMDFADGAFIGIYDAEDRPAPDQITRIVEQFSAAPSRVACIQARLSYYNVEENWLTRCFELEYAGWFDAMMPGLRRLGLPLPLGGTSLFLRREALEAVGCWDSHNVTEDADLGMALARAGYETRLSDSITEEEASSRPAAWIAQRSRWMKGYLATWTTHMRDPGALWRDLGAAGFIGFNLVLAVGVLAYLILPALWIGGLLIWSFGAPPVGAAAAHAVATLGTVALAPLGAAVALGLHRRRRLRYAVWLPTIPIYWWLGACAAYLAAWELATNPTRWRKTRHGVGKIAGQLQSSRSGAEEIAGA